MTMEMERGFVIKATTEVLDDRTFDRHLLKKLAPLYRRAQNESMPLRASEVVVDLRGVRSMYPYAALGVLVLLEGLSAIFDQRVRLQLPAYGDAPECVMWMAESGFIAAALPWAYVDPHPLGGELPVRDDPYIIPVSVIEKPKHLRDLIEELLAKIPHLLGHALSQKACMRIITVFSELCQNILYYGANEEGVRGYAMLQCFRGIVKFAVADTGPGIPNTLRPKYHREIVPWDDSLATALAMQPRVTTRAEGGGLGLHHAKEVVLKHNGILNIRSGSGKVLVCRGDEYAYQARGIYSGPTYFWGTQIGIVLERP